jgi:hypothetical protein
MYDYRKQAITLFADIFLPEFRKIKRDFWLRGMRNERPSSKQHTKVF